MATTPRDKPATGYPPPRNPPTAGYPFVVPPPPSSYSNFYQEATFYQSPPPHPSISSFLCRFLAAVASVIAVATLIIFITWLILKPLPPLFRVYSASLNSLNTSGPDLTARWDFTLALANPNHKLSISHDAVSASVFYGDEVRSTSIASTRLAPFTQPTKSEDRVRVQFEVVDEFVDYGVAKGIAADRARGSVRFGVTVFAWVRFESKIVRSRDHLFKVDCYPVRFVFSPNNGTGFLMNGLSCK